MPLPCAHEHFPGEQSLTRLCSFPDVFPQGLRTGLWCADPVKCPAPGAARCLGEHGDKHWRDATPHGLRTQPDSCRSISPGSLRGSVGVRHGRPHPSVYCTLSVYSPPRSGGRDGAGHAGSSGCHSSPPGNGKGVPVHHFVNQTGTMVFAAAPHVGSPLTTRQGCPLEMRSCGAFLSVVSGRCHS